MDEQPDDDVRAPGQNPLAWILVAAVAVPAVLAGDVARRVLAGELDAYFGASFGSSGQLSTITQRWEWVQFGAPPETGALASALGLVVVAAIMLAQQPRVLVPPRPARWLAVAAGAVTVVVAGGTVLGTLVYAARDVPTPDTSNGYDYTSTDYVTLAPRVGPAVLALTLAIAATLVVLRAPGAATTDAETTTASSTDAEPTDAPTTAASTTVRGTVEGLAPEAPARRPPAPDEPSDERAPAEPAAAQRDAWAAVPHLREDQRALYQRPHPAPAARA